MHNLRWDDLQMIIAVAESGSASAAADLLSVNHSTVLRRIATFEKQQGIKLFERHATGYRPTSAAHDIVAAASRMRDTVDGIRRDILGQDDRLSGQVRLTTTDTIVSSILGRHLAAFSVSHPGIMVNLTMTNVRLDISRLDAEVSIRPSRNPPEELLGRRVSGLAFAIYTSAEHTIRDISQIQHWIGTAGELKNAPVHAWFEDHIDQRAIIARANSFGALRELARAGIGATVLPCCLADHCPMLERVGAPLGELETALWVLTHPDIKSSARIAALSDFLAKALRTDRKLLEGNG